jgi:hypothetical protein
MSAASRTIARLLPLFIIFSCLAAYQFIRRAFLPRARDLPLTGLSQSLIGSVI